MRAWALSSTGYLWPGSAKYFRAAVYIGLCSLLPHFLLVPMLGVLAPISGVAGVYYAWRHNQTGERTGLFSDKGKPKTDRR